jgi:hypothetical protein
LDTSVTGNQAVINSTTFISRKNKLMKVIFFLEEKYKIFHGMASREFLLKQEQN